MLDLNINYKYSEVHISQEIDAFKDICGISDEFQLNLTHNRFYLLTNLYFFKHLFCVNWTH